MRILATLLEPDAGRAEVDGLDVVRDAERVRARIGLTGQYAAVDEYLTGGENLEMVGRLYHLPKRRARERADELLERFDLVEAGRRQAKTYSGGMRRRLDLAASLVVAPPILFLDEPTTGLDPRSRQVVVVWDLIGELVAGGTTLLLTTQYLDEADRLADRIAVIDSGRVIAEGTSNELKDQVGGERVEATVAQAEQLDAAVGVLVRLGEGAPQVDPERGRARARRSAPSGRGRPRPRRRRGGARGPRRSPSDPGRRVPRPHRARHRGCRRRGGPRGAGGDRMTAVAERRPESLHVAPPPAGSGA